MSHTELQIETADGHCPTHVYHPSGGGPWPHNAKVSSPGNVLSRLKRFGIAVTETSSERTGRVLGVRDPDGRSLYLVERPV